MPNCFEWIIIYLKPAYKGLIMGDYKGCDLSIIGCIKKWVYKFISNISKTAIYIGLGLYHWYICQNPINSIYWVYGKAHSIY